MTVQELIEILRRHPPKAEIHADANSLIRQSDPGYRSPYQVIADIPWPEDVCDVSGLPTEDRPCSASPSPTT